MRAVTSAASSPAHRTHGRRPAGQPKPNPKVRKPMTRRFARLALVASTLLALIGVVPGGASAVTLTPPPPAAATCQSNPNGTICFWLDTAFHTPGAVPYGVTCGGFSVRVQLAGERRFRLVYDVNGVLI